jgi:FMN phosphatase YigB (HAD superfamily)
MAHIYTPDNPYIFEHQIKRALFDNDGTLYTEPEDAKIFHVNMAIKAVQGFIPSLSDSDVRALIDLSRKMHGGSLEIFPVESNHISFPGIRRAHYSELIKGAERTDYLINANPDPEGLELLKSSGVQMGVVTHGTPEWAVYTYCKMLYTDIFNLANTTTKDEVPQNKNDGYEMFRAGLLKMGVPTTKLIKDLGKGSVAVEDTIKNLKGAKELGMETILVAPELVWDRKEDVPRYLTEVWGKNVPDYVDVVVRDISHVAHCILQSNAQYGIYPPGYDNQYFPSLEN